MCKNLYFIILAILLPVFFIGIIELVLRTADLGEETCLFKKTLDHQYYVMNTKASVCFFSVSENSTIGNQDYFLVNKSKETIRIFVLGASSALGFPYMYNGSFARMLKYRLQFRYPYNNIEIVNISLTAVNSYTLWDFGKQLMSYSPDCILIYAGHNEYYGAMGVASSSKYVNDVWINRLLIKSKKIRIIQLLGKCISHLKNNKTELTNKNISLMARMVHQATIPYESKPFMLGIQQYERNMSDLIDYFNQQHIPVFIGTLAANLKDQRPLDCNNGEKTIAFNEFQKGDSLFQLGNYSESLHYYLMAKEHDEIRFRAPDTLNSIIRGLSKFPNVSLVDTERALRDQCKGHIIGKEVLLEHVHPNLKGSYIMADCFFNELENKFFSKLKYRSVHSNIIDKDLPYTAFDTISGDLTIQALKQQWPFNETSQNFEGYKQDSFESCIANMYFSRHINWEQAMRKLNNYYILQKDYTNALRIIEQMYLDVPYEVRFAEQALNLSKHLKFKEKIAFYSQKVIMLHSLNSSN